MKQTTFEKLWPNYKAAYPWIEKESTISFVGITEDYELMQKGYKKRESFWHSRFWAWLKRNHSIKCNHRCEQCGNLHDALHHKNNTNYFEPLVEHLEYLCGDCHNKEHFRGNYCPSKTLENKMKTGKTKSRGFKTEIVEGYRKDPRIKSMVDGWAKRLNNDKASLRLVGQEAQSQCKALCPDLFERYSKKWDEYSWESMVSTVLNDLGLRSRKKKKLNAESLFAKTDDSKTTYAEPISKEFTPLEMLLRTALTQKGTTIKYDTSGNIEITNN